MDIKDLRPKVFAVDPHCRDAKRQWLHWHRSFITYVLRLVEVSDADKLTLLINHVDAVVYEVISEATTYDDAVKCVSRVVRETTESSFCTIFAEVLQAATRRDTRAIRAETQNFLPVSASQRKEEAIRDAFTGGIVCSEIRQRPLEENNLSLDNTISKARSLEAAHRNAELFSAGSPQGSFVHQTAAVPSSLENDSYKSDED